MASVNGTAKTVNLRTPLYMNSHFRVALIGDHDYGGKLALRYHRLAQTLAPQIREHVRARFPASVDVCAITLLGSASAYRHYNDIDVCVLLRRTDPSVDTFGRKRQHNEKTQFQVTDERKVPFRKKVHIGYYDIDALTGGDFASSFFSKPVLFGEVPVLFGSQLPELLARMTDAYLYVFSNWMKQNNHRKAMHLLASACRGIYDYSVLTGKMLPTGFSKTVELLYGMENSDNYDYNGLADSGRVIGGWRSGLKG